MLQRKCLRGWGMVKCQGALRGYRTRGSKLIRLRTVKHESHDTNARANTTLDHQLVNLSHFGPGFDDKHQLRKCPHELCHAAHSQPKGIFGVGCTMTSSRAANFRPSDLSPAAFRILLYLLHSFHKSTRSPCNLKRRKVLSIASGLPEPQ